MSASLTQAAAKRVAALFGPLSQIELAASRLARECATPAARELVAAVRAAVRELDAGVSDALVWLVPAGGAASDGVDVAPTLRELALRLGPVLAARERSLRVTLDDGCSATGDPELVRRVAVCLLRIAASLAGRGGTLTLGMVRDATRIGVETQWQRVCPGHDLERVVQQRQPRSDDDASVAEAIAQAQAVCATGGGALEQVERADAGRLVAWFGEVSLRAAGRTREVTWPAF